MTWPWVKQKTPSRTTVLLLFPWVLGTFDPHIVSRPTGLAQFQETSADPSQLYSDVAWTGRRLDLLLKRLGGAQAGVVIGTFMVFWVFVLWFCQRFMLFLWFYCFSNGFLLNFFAMWLGFTLFTVKCFRVLMFGRDHGEEEQTRHL